MQLLSSSTARLTLRFRRCKQHWAMTLHEHEETVPMGHLSVQWADACLEHRVCVLRARDLNIRVELVFRFGQNSCSVDQA